jgi:hypothetical protein
MCILKRVKLLISTTCASHCTLKSGDFIGAYLQAKVIGHHFVRLPLEYAYYFPEYAKHFGTPSLLNKGIYGLVYSGKYWNIQFSEWLYSKELIQSQAEPSFFSSTTSTINGYAFSFLLTTCSMLAAMMPLKKNSKTLYTIALTSNFYDLQNGSYKCISTSTKTKFTPLINIATFLTPYNVTIQTWNSLNVKLHSHLTTPSAKITDQSLIMTSTSLKNNTNAFPSALPFVRYFISPTTHAPIFSLQFANLQKPVSALAKPTSVLFSGS